MPQPNPFHPLLHTPNSSIPTAYINHRTSRTKTQRERLLNPPSPSNPSAPKSTEDPRLQIDATLHALITKAGGVDTPAAAALGIDKRQNLVFWARPPGRVGGLLEGVQRRLVRGLGVGEDVLYLHPPAHFHLTVLEIASGQPSPSVVNDLEQRLRPAIGPILDLTARTFAEGKEEEIKRGNEKRKGERQKKVARLGKPCVTYDAQGVAVSFLPIVDDRVGSGEEGKDGRTEVRKEEGKELQDDEKEEVKVGEQWWTYHHLRTAAFDLASPHVEVASRYVVPSAHITIARWHAQPADVQATVERLVSVVEEINAELEEMGYDKWEWVVGEEVALELRKGACWYGGGGECVGRGRGVDFGSGGGGGQVGEDGL